MYKLNVEIAFTDKETKKKNKIGDVIEVNDKRAEELLADSRNLVSVNEKKETKKKMKTGEDSEDK